jgi:hypothetical protein
LGKKIEKKFAEMFGWVKLDGKRDGKKYQFDGINWIE